MVRQDTKGDLIASMHANKGKKYSKGYLEGKQILDDQLTETQHTY